jgi:hypothetical protein
MDLVQGNDPRGNGSRGVRISSATLFYNAHFGARSSLEFLLFVI